MIRIFPDFSVQVTAAAAGGAAGGVPAGPGMGRASTAANGNPQNVQGITSYQQRITVQHPLPNQSECRKIYRYDGIYCESTYQNLQALRKEKSRDAARSRRGKENFEFYELAKLLPLPAAITSQLDKASIIRLTISYLKMRDFANQGDPPWNLRMEGPPPNTSVKVIGAQRRRSPSALAIEVFESHLGSHILQSLDGFVFALNQEGKFLYISETVSIYLGLSQVELTGSSVFDYVHPGDHVEMAEQLGMKLPPGRGLLSQGTAEDGASSASSSSQSETPEPVESTSPSLLTTDNTLERSFFIRMKSTLTKRGVHIKSSGYKVIHITGRLRLRVSLSHGRTVPSQIMGLVVVAHALPPPTINEVRIDCHMFVTRVNMDLNIIYCENRISDYMDLTPVDIVGKRCYHFIHAEDVEGIRHSHLDLLNKGQCVTKYYRWMQKNGGYIWIQSSATIAINAKNANEKNIIWVNYLLSNPEYKDTPMDIAQLPHLPEKTSESSETSDSESDSKDNSEDNENSKSDDKGNQSENSEDPESDRKKSGNQSDNEMNCNDDGNSSSNQDSRDSDDSFENSDFENQKAPEDSFGTLGSMQIKVERYVESESDLRLQNCESLTSDSAKDSDSGGEVNAQSSSKHQKRKKRRKKQKGGSMTRRRLSSTSSPNGLDSALVDQPQLLSSPNSASVLKIKTEISEPINFDNDSSIWNYPPNREISRNESPYSMTKPPSSEHFPSPQASSSLHVSIPDSVLTPPGSENTASRKTQFSTSSSSALAPVSSDPLSPPLSASPRDKHPGGPSTSNSLLYTGDLEALQRLQAGNVVLPLVHRVTGTLAATSTAAQRVYTTGTIRYAPAEVTLAMQGNLLPNTHAVNFVDVNSPSFGLDPKTPMEMLYHHVHRLNMSGPFGSAVSGASLTQMPAGNVFTTAEGLFSTLPFPVYSNGIHTTQTLERKED
ncbi:neuronal PAS domain-containing protein 3 isoform X2 [Lepidochelys kempii]|uniref:neuronal PAS domain-containing protein 3 isoform X2 n=1 Tax=Mauremys reevesii TaxID=260615 RepID=UPI00193EFA27|nr:neuronal PAS domain-containing protein 3 isoform X2 [Mauremys reevesii]XP_043404306.1 neuronal PAS domain-containing protein 3 isoform X2 [Chelonia mydas]XP_048709991.1 neuronal PAS domain-containing protein 3 isoform X2 [Caretta caretta]XP_053884257.1 neuronal PAS domain-containing protein 3 isoform X2 [Malaclemys terrapin pileata]